MDLQFQYFFFFQHLKGTLRQLEMIGDPVVDAFQIMCLTSNFFRAGLMGDKASAFQKDQLSLLQFHTIDSRIHHACVEIIQHQQRDDGQCQTYRRHIFTAPALNIQDISLDLRLGNTIEHQQETDDIQKPEQEWMSLSLFDIPATDLRQTLSAGKKHQ